jgi:hypothetical protein
MTGVRPIGANEIAVSCAWGLYITGKVVVLDFSYAPDWSVVKHFNQERRNYEIFSLIIIFACFARRRQAKRSSE